MSENSCTGNFQTNMLVFCQLMSQRNYSGLKKALDIRILPMVQVDVFVAIEAAIVYRQTLSDC